MTNALLEQEDEILAVMIQEHVKIYVPDKLARVVSKEDKFKTLLEDKRNKRIIQAVNGYIKAKKNIDIYKKIK